MQPYKKTLAYFLVTAYIGFLLLHGVAFAQPPVAITTDPALVYKTYTPAKTDLVVSRADYHRRMQGFWLGQCLANWTGLVTEMDKIGNIGDIKTGPFYTRHHWGKPDEPNIWTPGIPSPLSPTIHFVFAAADSIWGADDDTDIEYMYQELILKHRQPVLSGDQIRAGWLKHIKQSEENYLWVSNQKAFDLMQLGLVPPQTGDPAHNPEFEMIDAQLTTEIFGLFAPARPDFALQMAELPIKTTARENAEWIAQFYVTMHALALVTPAGSSRKEQVCWMADRARRVLPNDSYSAKMYDFVKEKYNAGIPWEQARDEVYNRYQVMQADGYNMTAQNRYCNGCSAAGINFAASLISLFYGEGDWVETVKIAVLAGWDSDNPAATWGGLLGFMMGKDGIEQAMQQTFSSRFHIHRTRIGFDHAGIDHFDAMATKAIWIVDRVVQEHLQGGIDLNQNMWYIPNPSGH